MRSTLKTAATLAMVALVGLGIGCKPKPKAAAEAQPTPVLEATATPTVVHVEPTPAPTPAIRDDVMSKTADQLSGYLKPALFDFDKYDIRPDARDALTADASWLKKYPSIKFRIEGHCDERGTREYNQALGEKRASAAKDYLVSLGIDGGRIDTISYGKERPFCTGHDEDCWQQNRRAHFVVTAK